MKPLRTAEALAALTLLAYIACVAVSFPRIVDGLYWNTDAAGAFVIASLYHLHHTVVIPRFGWWTSLWWMLATRHLPGHVVVWEATGYVFVVLTAATVGWATGRIAGRTAGIVAAACTIVVGPAALSQLVIVNFHTSTPFTAAVLSAYLVVLARTRSWVVTVGVGVLAAVNTASDPIGWIAAIAPFFVGTLLLAFLTRRRDIALRGGLVCGLTLVGVPTTDFVMRELGFHLVPVTVQLASIRDDVTNFIKLGKAIALLFGANHYFPGTYPSTGLRYAITFIAFAGAGATFVAAARFLRRRSDPQRTAYACYWAVSALLVACAFWLTNIGTGAGPAGYGVSYLFALIPAIGAGVGLVTAGWNAGPILASIAIAFVGSVNMAAIVKTQKYGGIANSGWGASVHGPQVIRFLEQRGLEHGYAGYYDSQSLMWKSGLRFVTISAYACSDGVHLCKIPDFTIDSWFKPRRGPTFLIVDPEQGLTFRPPPSFGRPSVTRHFGPQEVVYVYPRDVIASIVR